MLVGGLQQFGRVAHANFIQLAETHRVALIAGTQQVGVGGERHDELAPTPIGFGDRDVQVAPIAGREQVIEHERAGGDGNLVQ